MREEVRCLPVDDVWMTNVNAAKRFEAHCFWLRRQR